MQEHVDKTGGQEETRFTVRSGRRDDAAAVASVLARKEHRRVFRRRESEPGVLSSLQTRVRWVNLPSPNREPS